MLKELSAESKQLILKFDEKFQKYKCKKIALYGLGSTTSFLVNNLQGFNIVGLMDKANVSGMCYGKPILTVSEAIENVDLIIIIATKISTKIIYKRICNLKDEGIEILALCDLDYCEDDDRRHSIEYSKYEDLIKQIDEHDIISFDLFDTLIMRKCINPELIFKQLEIRANKVLDLNLPIEKRRLESSSNSSGIVDLDYIYSKMDVGDYATKIKELELQIEIDNIIPRTRVVEAFNYAKNVNKTVVITSDMYLNSQYITKLLDKCNIIGYNKLLISCETKKSKRSGDIWELIKYKEKRILHIGDDEIADIKMAERFGINTFHIKSSFELFSSSAFSNMTKHIRNLQDTFILNLVISNLFNNPFNHCAADESKNTDIFIEGMFNVGYGIISAITIKYLVWLNAKLKEFELEQLLFLSRDGYIIQKLYDIVCEKDPSFMNLKNEYFISSRVIINSCEKSSELLRLYKQYIKKFELDKYKTGVVDLIGTGRNLFYIRQITDCDLKGLNFAKRQLATESFNQDLFLNAMYDETSNAYLSNYFFTSATHIAECVFTAPDGCVMTLNDDLTFVYEQKSNEIRDYKSIDECHRGIMAFLNDYIMISNGKINEEISLDIVDNIFGIITSSYTGLSQDIKDGLLYYDIETDKKVKCFE